MQVNDTVRFNQGDSLGKPVLTGVITRVHSNALYVTVEAQDGKKYIRSVKMRYGILMGDSPPIN